MSQSEGTSNTKSSTVRTSWKDSEKVKFFLDCCIHEVARAGRAGTSLRKESWEKVAKQLKEKYNIEVTQKQMKNQFDYFMTPYRNTRYWINDFRRGVHAQGKEEVFNQAHAKLRNVIERTFGVLKARYRILNRMLPYSLATQRDIVIACCALHNFLRREKVKDQLFTYFEDPNACVSSSSQVAMSIDESVISTIGESSRQGDQQFMTQLRDQLANDLMKNRRTQTQRQRHA